MKNKSKKKRLLALGLLFILLFAAMKVYAYYKDVISFGFDQDRARYASDMSGIVTSDSIGENKLGWVVNAGTSLSQPLIVDGSQFGRKNPVVIFVAGNKMYAYESIPPDSPLLYDPKTFKPLIITNNNKIWGPAYLYGDGKGGGSAPSAETGSHPTLYKNWLVTGTRDAQIFINDVHTGSLKLQFGTRSAGGSDVTSAPLVMRWNGYNIIVGGDGSGGDVIVAYFSDDLKGKAGVIPVGGRISSSPAPVYDKNGNAQGFLIGIDEGTEGYVYKFNFSDIFDTSNGIRFKSSISPKWKAKSSSGIPASFSVDGDYIYFSNDSGTMYKLNKYTGDLVWYNKTYYDLNSTFINRSPAYDENYVYFSFQYINGTGHVIVLNKNTGNIVKDIRLPSDAGTAVSVTKSDIYVGTADGYLNIIDKATWTVKRYNIGTPVSGEISIAHGLVSITNNNGDYTLYLAGHPVDLYVKGINVSQPVMLGKEAAGTVSFGLSKNTSTPVDAYIRIYDEANPNVNLLGNNNKITLQPGQEQSFSFNFNVADSTTKLKATIYPVPETENGYLKWWDVNLSNNEKETEIEAEQIGIGNLTLADIQARQGNTVITTIDKPTNVTIYAKVNSLFSQPGTATLRLYKNGALAGTQKLHLDPFATPVISFGSFYVSGGEVFSASVDYNNSSFAGDNNGSEYGEKYKGDDGKLYGETQYADNIQSMTLGKAKQSSYSGTLHVDFNINSPTYNSFANMPTAMVGDAITTTNLTEDNNQEYGTYKIIDIYHYVANSSPWGSHRVAPYTQIQLVNLKNAIYNNYKWYLPTPSGIKISQSNNISFTTQKMPLGSLGNSTGTDYGYVDLYKWNLEEESYTNSWWYDGGYDYYVPVTDADGNIHYVLQHVTIPRIGQSQSFYTIFGTPEYTHSYNAYTVSYGRVESGPVATKRYNDDNYVIESPSYYDMYITLSDWDYYSHTPWAGIPQHWGTAQKPLRIYYNNAPVAYFTIIGDINAANSNVSLQDLSYDPDYDIITAEKWDVDGKTFMSKEEAENYINTVVAKQPGDHIITLYVQDDPRNRYNRLSAKWSEGYTKLLTVHQKASSPVSYKAEITFDRDIVYTMWHPGVDTPHSQINLHVKVTDVGYWTYDKGVNGEKILRFVPIKVTEVKMPYTDIVRYKNMGHMTVNPVYFKATSQTNNSFEYDVTFEYPKAGTLDSKMVFPFVTDYFGEIDTLVKNNTPVNAFNITYADPPGPDVTRFYAIKGLGINRTDYYLLKNGELHQDIRPDPNMKPVPYIGREDTKITDGLKYIVDYQVYPY